MTSPRHPIRGICLRVIYTIFGWPGDEREIPFLGGKELIAKIEFGRFWLSNGYNQLDA